LYHRPPETRRFPQDADRFDFPTFYDRLHDLGFVIYPGKVSGADCFRIGTIGRIFPDDVRALLRAVETCCQQHLAPAHAPARARR
jgi:2-aminoethylphosphonate-pyruvate transaminase